MTQALIYNWLKIIFHVEFIVQYVTSSRLCNRELTIKKTIIRKQKHFELLKLLAVQNYYKIAWILINCKKYIDRWTKNKKVCIQKVCYANINCGGKIVEVGYFKKNSVSKFWLGVGIPPIVLWQLHILIGLSLSITVSNYSWSFYFFHL